MARLGAAIIAMVVLMYNHQLVVSTNSSLLYDINSVVNFISVVKSTVQTYDKQNKSIMSEKLFELSSILVNEPDYQVYKHPDIDILMKRSMPGPSSLQQIYYSLHKFIGYYERVNTYFNDFREYSHAIDKWSNRTITVFIEKVISNVFGYLGERLYLDLEELFIPYGRTDLNASLLVQYKKVLTTNYPEMCDNYFSPYQWLSLLYTMIAETQLRAFVIVAWANTLLPDYKAECIQQLYLNDVEAEVVDKLQTYIKSFKLAVSGDVPRDIYRCNSQRPERGKTYLELTRLFQGFIAIEPDLNSDSCKADCSSLPRDTADYETQLDGYHSDQRCNGRITDCVRGGGEMNVCWAANNSSRRYEWFKGAPGDYGKTNRSCAGTLTNPSGWPRWPLNCDLCICTCSADFADLNSLRTLSFLRQTSDIDKNMVVTGVKFVEQHKMLHIKIKHGKLLEQGKIYNETWKPITNIIYMALDRAIIWTMHDLKNEYKLLKVSEDYAYISKDQRTLNLDDVIVPKGHVVTGVRFAHPQVPKNGQDWQPFELQVRATPFNFTTGKLNNNPNSSVWITPTTMKPCPRAYSSSRTEFKLNSPDTPILLDPPQSMQDSQPNQYIQFRASDFTLDAGQTTVPLFDAQPILFKQPFPLGGIGVFHKGSKYSGGFITLKVFNYDFIDYVKDEMYLNKTFRL